MDEIKKVRSMREIKGNFREGRSEEREKRTKGESKVYMCKVYKEGFKGILQGENSYHCE